MCFGGGGSKGGSSSSSSASSSSEPGAADPNALFKPMPGKDGTVPVPEKLKPWATHGSAMGKEGMRRQPNMLAIANPAYGTTAMTGA